MRSSDTHPLTEEEFDVLLNKVDGRYKKALTDIYKYGKKLPEVCESNNISRRNLQK